MENSDSADVLFDTVEVGKDGSMNPRVKSVRALDDYELEISFENGESCIFDVKPFLSRGIFVRLRDRSLFQAVRAVAGSIAWPGGLDLSYDTLYLGGQPIAGLRSGDEHSSEADGQTRASDVPH